MEVFMNMIIQTIKLSLEDNNKIKGSNVIRKLIP